MELENRESTGIMESDGFILHFASLKAETTSVGGRVTFGRSLDLY